VPAIVETVKLQKRYGRVEALREVSLAIEPGVVGLLGPNGAGKSTLLSVLLGQVPATGGQASVLGFNVLREQQRIRRRIGFMPENDCLIAGLSGVGYVHYCGRLAGMSHADAMQRGHEVLDYVGLGDARYRPAEEYSAGMKQRLKLAQAIVHDPDLLFLDEPTNGMDPQGRVVMLELIRDLGRCGISVLLSSHLLPDVERVCARVIIMGGGEVLTEGDIADMRAPHPTRYTVAVAASGTIACNGGCRRIRGRAARARSAGERRGIRGCARHRAAGGEYATPRF
jgi:ABC-2 type transport system ATP-binding protein